MMKRSAMIAVAMLSLSSYGLLKDPAYLDARRKGAETKIVLKVVDDMGTLVSNATINIFFGMNFRPKGHAIIGETDENGVFTAVEKTCGDEIEISIDKSGYYPSKRKLCYATMGKERLVRDGRWLPYGDMQQVVLRKRRNPVATERFWEFRYTKEVNSWIGFDIEKNDFVRPYGIGTISDFEVFIDWDGEWLPKYKGMAVEIRFADPFSGYYETPANTESSFIGPYRAEPAANYAQNAKFSEQVRGGGEIDESHFNKSNCWVVRSRCKVNEKGELVSANYTVIHDITFACKKGRIAGFSIIGFFNPTPNDTNLEAKQ